MIEWKAKSHAEIVDDIYRLQAAVQERLAQHESDHNRMEWLAVKAGIHNYTVSIFVVIGGITVEMTNEANDIKNFTAPTLR